ncbi:hypothetical protein [Pseudonocardia xishanensis]|uniref:DUF2795 domain-containing protein n=1 Tax=Pseudonocardia xishanensis TaxID=630995 RepID=A0ABP8S336_9PSEU
MSAETEHDAAASRPHPREMMIRFLLDKVRADPYPSGRQLDMIEESLTPDLVPEYVEVLIEKSRESEFPSNDLLARLQRMAG